MRIACLHTAESNVAVFEMAARQLNLPTTVLHHAVRADLLVEAEPAGRLTTEIEHQTCNALMHLARNADAVLLTCSTLGPCVAAASAMTAVPVIRVDDALAKEATRTGDKVVALCAVATTIEPTAQVFSAATRQSGADVEVRLVDGAWSLFRAGEHATYLAAIALAAEDAYANGAIVVALAQASMANAAELVTNAPVPLTSPAAGLIAAAKVATARSSRNGPLSGGNSRALA